MWKINLHIQSLISHINKQLKRLFLSPPIVSPSNIINVKVVLERL